MLGNKIYYPDEDTNKVCDGRIVGLTINEEGFSVYTIKDGEKYVVLNTSLCSDNFEEAQEHLNKIVETNAEIRKIQDEANKKIDTLLMNLRGEPEYEYLTIKAERKAEGGK